MVASRRSVRRHAQPLGRSAARPRGPAIEAVALPVAVLVAVIVLVGMAGAMRDVRHAMAVTHRE